MDLKKHTGIICVEVRNVSYLLRIDNWYENNTHQTYLELKVFCFFMIPIATKLLLKLNYSIIFVICQGLDIA